MRAATTTPVEPSGADLARLPVGGGLPRYYGGSASTLTLSRPAQCSLTLRPAWPTAPQKGTFPGVLQTIRRLLIRPRCFRLERELPGGICTHGTGAPWQGTHNVFVERLWRSVKHEEVYLRAYDTVAEARTSIAGYFSFYNSRRPHSSLDRQTPDQAYFTPLPQIAAA
jgi:putative transposase